MDDENPIPDVQDRTAEHTPVKVRLDELSRSIAEQRAELGRLQARLDALATGLGEVAMNWTRRPAIPAADEG